VADDLNGEQTFIRVTNQMIWVKLNEIEDRLDDLRDYPEVKKNVRKLELKFYGILAGLISAVAVLGVVLPKIQGGG